MSAQQAMVRAKQTAGFSLIELMVVTVIIGIMSAAIAPSMSDILADHRQAAATMDIVRIGRQARALTMSSGVAYALHFQPGVSGLGMIDLLRGATGRCRQTPWAQAADRPVMTVSLATYNPTGGSAPKVDDTGRHIILLEASLGGTVLTADEWICYQPNGDTYLGTGTPPAAVAFTRQSDTNPLTMAVMGLIRSSGHDSTRHGQRREVLFAAGDTPRMR